MEEFWFFTTFGGAIATALGFALAWASARSRANRLEDQLTGRLGRSEAERQLEARLNELAAQVEELARSQDFLHRLISRKLERLPVPVERPREITPH
jgi:hypothetical protein